MQKFLRHVSFLMAALVLCMAFVLSGCQAGDAVAAGAAIATIPAGWPSCFAGTSYVEPPFTDDPNRENNAFNVADFGEQGSNGWFYRYGSPTRPWRSMRMERFNGERYSQMGMDGLEIKKDFIHTANGTAPILEWRAAQNGAVNIKITYVKDVNGDANPGYPDGVRIYAYKGEELLESQQVPIYVDHQTLMETSIDDLTVTEGESLYFVVDPQDNNAYDGGQLYVAIQDVDAPQPTVLDDPDRKDNNANNIQDFGFQGHNGWSYLYGKDVETSALVSSMTGDGYINYTSPGLVISNAFIHPAINDNAILCWTPYRKGTVEVRGTYTKFEQNDGNPDWPDGVTVSIYLNNKKLFEKQVEVLRDGTVTVKFREAKLNVTPNDRLYFMVSAGGNSSYDGGSFDITIMDRNGRVNENAIEVYESDTRQNFVRLQDDFGVQGNNGLFFQEGYEDQPFGAYNIVKYVKDEKYYDDRYLEIKRDYVNVGENGESAVIKWRVAQTGTVAIDASYTKLKNEDPNPDWPDGTRVTLYRNNTVIARQEFAPLVNKEVTKDLSVPQLNVERGDYITMVVNGKDNNAYDGGQYKLFVRSTSGLVGATENNVTIPDDDQRTNNANVMTDFGPQGANGWFYQYSYYNDPFFAINVEKYDEKDEKYYTLDGIEIKRDYIMPSTKGKSAQVKWKVAQDGVINIYADYTKLLNQDANPSWPDGTTVTLLHNRTVLNQKYFAPNTKVEVTGDLSVLNRTVKKGDYITLIVYGGDNTAYDGGKYSFEIEDATIVTIDKTNDSGVNRANLAADFTGEQGANGWYYMEGRKLETASALTKKTDDGTGFTSVSDSNLQVKSDFVQPGLKKMAMYQWVAAQDGDVDVVGQYTKFGHEDGNPSWPDGTTVRVYHNDQLLFEQDAAVLQGDGNNTEVPFELLKLAVKKGDVFTFVVAARNNNAWDGGRLAVQIKPNAGDLTFTNDSGSNNANLEKDFGEQGSNGWYYGYGNDGGDFKPADKNGEEYSYPLISNLLLKKDGVHPGATAGAIYRWVAAEDGELYLKGGYFKSRNENADDTTPDGVQVDVYLNGTLIPGMSYDVGISTQEELFQAIENDGLEVKKDDKIDFVITAKATNTWDYGKLEMTISDHEIVEPQEPEYKNDSDSNSANLESDFGGQGSNGWYYGVCDWDGNGFATIDMQYSEADGGKWLYNGGKPDLRRDFVEPGSGKSAAYMWVAAQDGKITITGSYTKYPNADDPGADGVSFRVFQNPGDSNVKQFASMGGGLTHDETAPFDLTLTVVKGDRIIFAVNPEGNDSYDSGKLIVSISGDVTDPKDPEFKNDSTENKADLAADFSDTQGGNGWYYGVCDWDGNGFAIADMQHSEADGGKWLYNGGKPDLRRDFVEPGSGKSAAYMWVAAQDGKITITGSYTKYPNADDPGADGVTFRIFQNPGDENVKLFANEGIQGSGLTGDGTVVFDVMLTVAKGDQIIFAVNPEGNDSYDSGKLETTISESTEEPGPEEPKEPEIPKPPVITEYKNDGDSNTAALAGDFSGEQGAKGWYYGSSHYDGSQFTPVGFDADNNRYLGADGLELKADFVHPGPIDDISAAYMWVAAKDGNIVITGNYAKLSDGNTSFRIIRNPDGTKEELMYSGSGAEINKSIWVTAGDQIFFVVTPEGDNSNDGGTLVVTITEADAEPSPEESEESEPAVDSEEPVSAVAPEDAELPENFGEAELLAAPEEPESPADPEDPDPSADSEKSEDPPETPTALAKDFSDEQGVNS